MLEFKVIKARKNSRILKDWKEWLEQAARLNSEMFKRIERSPFYFHEQAIVGHLVNAAGRVNLLTLSEYQLSKRADEDLRRRVPGRADLWLDVGARCYSFEFKTAWHDTNLSKLRDVFDLAKANAISIPSPECDIRVAAMTAYFENKHDQSVYLEFAAEADFCFQFGGLVSDGAYLYASET